MRTGNEAALNHFLPDCFCAVLLGALLALGLAAGLALAFFCGSSIEREGDWLLEEGPSSVGCRRRAISGKDNALWRFARRS